MILEGATTNSGKSREKPNGNRWEQVSKDVVSMKRTIEAVKGATKKLEVRSGDKSSGKEMLVQPLCYINNSLTPVIFNLHKTAQ